MSLHTMCPDPRGTEVSFIRGFYIWGKLGSKQMNGPISVMTRRGMERPLKVEWGNEFV